MHTSKSTFAPSPEGFKSPSEFCTPRAPSPSPDPFEALAALLDPDRVLESALARWPDFERFAAGKLVHALDAALGETFEGLMYAAAVLARGDYAGTSDRELEHAMARGLALYRGEDEPAPLEVLTAPGGLA